jgi:CheY-like chemotaxis protein
MARVRAEGEQALRESQHNLTAANLQLAEADRRKDEFLAMLGHELRNPLGVIASAVQLIRTRGLHDPVLEKALGAAQRQSDHMTRLVEELLDVARITEGKVTLRQEVVRLAQVIDAAVEAARPDVETAGHRLYCSVPTESLKLVGDSVRLVQIVGNLLNNAAKYTPPGGEIHLALERVGHDAVIRVRDTGQGMPPALLASAFDLFVQGTRGTDRRQGGLGIGLTLARRLVEMHGGRILAASEGIGLGSEFTVTLPLADERQLRQDPSLRDEHVSPTARRRILVVDDHRDGAEMLRLLLEHEGHDLEVAHDGATALALIMSSRPEFVILDIGMPEMDGYEVALRVRQNSALASVRLIALTGYGQEADTVRSHESGFDNHLVKPVTLEALRKVLR